MLQTNGGNHSSNIHADLLFKKQLIGLLIVTVFATIIIDTIPFVNLGGIGRTFQNLIVIDFVVSLTILVLYVQQIKDRYYAGVTKLYSTTYKVTLVCTGALIVLMVILAYARGQVYSTLTGSFWQVVGGSVLQIMLFLILLFTVHKAERLSNGDTC